MANLGSETSIAVAADSGPEVVAISARTRGSLRHLMVLLLLVVLRLVLLVVRVAPSEGALGARWLSSSAGLASTAPALAG